MNVTGLIIALLVGAVAGFLSGQIIKGRGFGLVGNIVVGILGALIFGFLFGNFNLLNSPVTRFASLQRLHRLRQFAFDCNSRR